MLDDLHKNQLISNFINNLADNAGITLPPQQVPYIEGQLTQVMEAAFNAGQTAMKSPMTPKPPAPSATKS